MTADDDLCVQLDSLDPSTLWCALIQTGKRNRRDLLHRVEEFLSHPDGYVREAALKVVAFYWKLPEYRDYAMEQVRGDEDPRVREAAAMALGDYGRGDSNVLRRLLEVALDPAEAEDVRDAAYHGALTVAGISRAEYPRAYWRPDWEARADWALLARMVRSCGATVPPRLAELASRPRLITPEEAAEAAAAAVRAGRPAAPPSHLVRLDAATFHATPCEGWQLAEVLLAIEAIRPGLRWYAADVSTAQQPLGAMRNTSLSNGEPVRLYTAPLQEGGAVLGMLVLGTPLSATRRLQQQFVYGLLILIPAILALSAGGGLFLANRALTPISKITRMAQQVSAEDISTRLHLDLPDDEIGRLARTLDAMLDRLDDAFRREQQLTADVSHELRTPLGLLKTQLSLARSKPRDAETLLKMMTDMEGDVDRLTRIVEQTLLLTQIENRGITAPKLVHLDEVLSSVLEQVARPAASKQIHIHSDLTAQHDWQTEGDAALLEQAFSNLVHNAITYTPSGGSVLVRARASWQGIIISVEDTGEGIGQEHLPYIFNRYYRVDSARARTSGGFGLGLAIVQSIIKAHHGSISVSSVKGEGTVFTVILPRQLAH